MSRIGKLPIKLAEKVKAVVDGQVVRFEGPKGKLTVKLPSSDVKAELKDGTLTVSRTSESRLARSLHGLTRSLMANAVNGVANGYEKQLSVRGVGYRAEVRGNQLHMALGLSHPVVFDLPAGVTAEVAKTGRNEDGLPTLDVTLRSADLQLLGEVAVRIRSTRPPEPYKGKGVKYTKEKVRRKEGKTGTA